MDIKVSRNYAAYQKAVSNAKHTEKSLSLHALCMVVLISGCDISIVLIVHGG